MIDGARPHDWLESQSTEGNQWAQTALGFSFHFGTGAEVNRQKSVEYFTFFAAGQGFAIAQFELATLVLSVVPKTTQKPQDCTI